MPSWLTSRPAISAREFGPSTRRTLAGPIAGLEPPGQLRRELDGPRRSARRAGAGRRTAVDSYDWSGQARRTSSAARRLSALFAQQLRLPLRGQLRQVRRPHTRRRRASANQTATTIQAGRLTIEQGIRDIVCRCIDLRYVHGRLRYSRVDPANPERTVGVGRVDPGRAFVPDGTRELAGMQSRYGISPVRIRNSH